MLYSRLIRSILEESVTAKLNGYDVADVLGQVRIGDDLVRKALILIACDPRFKETVRVEGSWRSDTQESLEELARLMDDDKELDDAKAAGMVAGFLSQYYLQELSRKDQAPGKLPPGKLEQKRIEKPLQAALAKLGDPAGEDIPNPEQDKGGLNGGKVNDKARQIDQPIINPGEAKGKKQEPGQDSLNKNGWPDADDDEELKEDKKDFGRGHNRLSPEEEQRVQTRFLRALPKGLRTLAKRIGRSGEDLYTPGGHFLTAAKSDIIGITVGNELSSLLPVEIATLACPQTQNIFLKRYAEKKLQVFASASGGNQTTPIHDDGPIVICLDSSGSMVGERIMVATALTMAVCIIASRRNRKVLVVKYSDSHSLFKVRNLRKNRQKLMQFLGSCYGGGNDENEMFEWLLQETLPKEGEFRNADLLCITDFGWEPIDYEIMMKIKELKEKGMKFYGLDVTGESHLKARHFHFDEDFGDLPEDVIDEFWLWARGDARQDQKHTRKK